MKRTIREELKMLLASRAITVKKMAEMLTEKRGKYLSTSTLSSQINRRLIKFEEVREIADLLGYKIEFKDIS